MDQLFDFLKNIGLVFSVIVSFFSLYTHWKNKPEVDVKIIDINRSDDLIAVRLSFQNSGNKMSSATEYLLEFNQKTIKALQVQDPIACPTGNSSISRSKSTMPQYKEAFPLELPQGKACHFTLIFRVGDSSLMNAKLKINLINHLDSREFVMLNTEVAV
ncbi:hypothetical protein KKHLCK_13965 [Candidatus Electrothrix laxa]